MNVLLLGSGGREHAMAWRLSLSDSVDSVMVIPGNPGMVTPKVSVHQGSLNDFDGLLKFVQDEKIDLVVVGPEGPLAAGIVDFFEQKNIPVFGPSKEAAKLESSKAFSKEFMKEFAIPTAEFEVYDKYEKAVAGLNNWDFSQGVVVKADSLAGGKGVVVTHEIEEAKEALYDFMVNPDCTVKTDKVVIEKKLTGKEVSVFAICDGDDYFHLGNACDYKRVGDGDVGPNTGGMGCYTPRHWPSESCMTTIREKVIAPTIEGMKKRGHPFKGILFVGLMVDGDDPSVIEYNVRLGDPETQTLMPLLKGDFGLVLKSACEGKLAALKEDVLNIDLDSICVHVVMASEGYPSIGKNKILTNQKISLGEVENKIFFAGVKREGDHFINSGGRVLGVSAIGNTLEEARQKAYGNITKIQFNGAHWRSDIGL